MSEFPDFGGPAWAPDMILPNGRLARLCKGGSSDAAVAEQRKAREQSAAQFAEQMGLMKQQYEDAQKVKTPVYAPAAPVASGGPDSYLAGLEARRVAAKRFGSAATVLKPLPAMGGARLAA